MTDTRDLEDRLRRVLTLDAGRAPTQPVTPEQFARRLDAAGTDQAIARLPRRGFPVRRTAAAVLIGAGVATFGLSSRDSTPAFASWASQPSSISAVDAARLGVACHAQHPLIVDRRGHSAYAVYSDGRVWTDCLATIPGLHPDKGLPDSWLSVGSLDAVAVTEPDAAHPVVVLSVKEPEGNLGDRAAVTWVSGRMSSTVARVSIQTSEGTVVPTVRDSVFAGWWPGNDSEHTVIRAYDRSGRLLSTIDQLNCGGGRLAPRTQIPGHAPSGGCS